MARFRSGLEALLRMRERTEDTARQELADSTRRREQTREELRAVDGELESQAKDLPESGCTVPLRLLQSGHARCRLLHNARRQKQLDLERACMDHERAREAAVMAQRELKTAEKLHDTARQTHLALIRKQENKALDEIGGRQPGLAGGDTQIEGETTWRAGLRE